MEKNPFLYLINLSRNKIKTNETHKQTKEKNRGISPIKLLKFTKNLHKRENNKEYTYSAVQTAPNIIHNNNTIENKKQIKNNHSQKKIKNLKNKNNDNLEKVEELKKKLKYKDQELIKLKRKCHSVVKENIILKKGINDYKNKIDNFLKEENLENQNNDLYKKIINFNNIIIENMNTYKNELNDLTDFELLKLNNKIECTGKNINKKKDEK